MSDAYYTLHIAGLERQLKRFPVSDSMDIAAFIFFGDVELTKAGAEELLKKVPEFDYIVTPEAKNTLWLARALRCIWTDRRR